MNCERRGRAELFARILHIPNPLMCLIKILLYRGFMNNNDINIVAGYIYFRPACSVSVDLQQLHS